MTPSSSSACFAWGPTSTLDQAELQADLAASLDDIKATSPADATRTGRVVGVLAAGGGAGGSTLSANLAVLLAGGSGRSVVIDLRLGAADQESLLDLKPQHNLADLCRNVRRLDRNMFEQSLARHASGAHLLSAPNAIDDVSAVTSQGVRQVLGFARASFPFVVVDLDRVLRPEQLAAVVQVDILLLPMRLEMTSLRSARRLIEALNKAGLPEERVIIVASRYGQAKELPLGKVEQALGLAIPYQIPDAPADINLASNKGVPVVLERPRAQGIPQHRKVGRRGPPRFNIIIQTDTARSLPCSAGRDSWVPRLQRQGTWYFGSPARRSIMLRSGSEDRNANQQTSQDAVDLLQIKRELHQQVVGALDLSTISTMSENELQAEVRRMAEQLCRRRKDLLSHHEREVLIGEVLDEVFGLGPLEPLFKDDEISDILVNGPNTVYIERHGRLELTEVKFVDAAHVLAIIHRVAGRVGRRIDETTPMVDARLADGSRLNAIVAPLALDGPLVSIRRFGAKPLTAEALIANHSLTPEMNQFLAACVEARVNVLVSGGTGSGKTTLLNAMSAAIPVDERVATIEDAAELQLQQPHVVRMETRAPNIEGQGEITSRDLVRNALRMRPDRIIVGECRGAEALDMLQAMNTGHEGSLTTVHANTPRDALGRLEIMVGVSGIDMPMWSIRRQIASAIHVIVQTAPRLNRRARGRSPQYYGSHRHGRRRGQHAQYFRVPPDRAGRTSPGRGAFSCQWHPPVLLGAPTK